MFKSEFIRNSAVLTSGNIAGQAVALLIYPLLSRLYSKEDFGIFALFMSLTGILNILATGKYEEAFLLTSDRKESSSLLNFSFRILSFVCLGIFIILLFWGETCFTLLRMQTLMPYWYCIPVFVFLSGFFILLTYAANREKYYKVIASSNLFLNIITSALKIGCKYLATGVTGLISGQIAGQFFACFPFYKIKSNIKEALRSDWKNAKTTGIRYQTFPKFTMPRHLINSFSFNLPFFLLTGIFGEAKSGLFFLALTVFFRPINLISNSLYQVFYENCARLKEDGGKISTKINTYQKYCLLSITPLFIITYIFSTILFKCVFGQEWEESGIYFRYILPWMFMVLLTAPMNFLPLLFNKQSKHMALEVVCFFVRYASLYIGIYYKNFDLSIILFGATGFLFTLISQIWYHSLIINYEKKIL
ncbi:MAG: oligosaccharide flippase family protein [Dysgonamonadaceae bacterium]|nr:oligosaccharide flippase family protein [Dysgonamonadaceae bacterium]